MIYVKSSVGVEIRGHDLVVTCLKSNFSGSVLTGFKRIESFRSREKEEVRQELTRFFRVQRLSREHIVLGIPRGEVVVRFLDLPREVEDNLKQVVLYQVQSYEPSESDRFYHDYLPLPPGEKDKRLRVFLVMVRKSLLDDYLGVLRELDLRPALVTVSSAALVNVFLGSLNGRGARTFVLSDVRPGSVETMLVRHGALVYSREAAREEGLGWSALLRREMELAASRARLDSEETIESIVLAGEASEAAHRELKGEIAECSLIGDLLRFEMPLENRPHLQEIATSLGLAFTGIIRRPPLRLNLLPPELRVRQARWAYIPTIVLGLAIAALLASLGAHRLIQEQIITRELEQQIQALQPQVDRVLRVRSQADALEKRIVFLEGLFRKRDLNLEILQELTSILPPDTFLNIYRNQDCSINISGSSNSAETLIPALEKSPLLANVVQRGTTFKDAQTGKDRFNFEAKCER